MNSGSTNNADHEVHMTKCLTSNRIENDINSIDKTEYLRSFRTKDKCDRATVEQVLDARISRIIYKLINKGDLVTVQGCISTGKEANVYYAKGANGKELAIKIYKTSILIFKDRDRYINGEFRFRNGYCKGNPRKMVALWAEKEVRNLKRLKLAGIKCPEPIILKSNLIVMEFIGKDEVAAQRLKDAEIDSDEEWERIYLEIIGIMRTMFKKCRLVHADFSEYNILYFEEVIYIIDVSQSVEDDHPNALNFLKRDCNNINIFFERKGVDVITNQQLFEIVSTFHLKQKREELINKFRISNYDNELLNAKFKEKENGLFGGFEIPRSLADEDLDKITGNCGIEDALSKLCGVKGKDQFDSDEDEDYEDEEEEDESEENSEEEKDEEKKKRFDPFEGMTKNERKNKVKIENKEKRANKKFSKKQKDKIVKKTSCKH